MITTSDKKPRTQEHDRSGPIDLHLDTFGAWLEARGYHPRYRRRLLRGAHRFALWSQHGKGVARELNALTLGLQALVPKIYGKGMTGNIRFRPHFSRLSKVTRNK